jgi:hypothetical protein
MWLRAAHHFTYVYASGAAILTERMESGERVRFSPDRSLAVVLATLAQNAVPVLESATGTIKFRLPLARAEAIAFSPDGDTIFAAGRASFNDGEPERLLAASAASGQIAIDTPLTVPMLWDLVLDSGGPWLYGIALTDDGAQWQPIIHVFDRHTLGHIASLRPPTAVVCRALFCGQVGLAIGASDRKLYVLEIAGWGTSFATIPSGIYAFDLVPTTQAGQILSP